MEVPDNNELLLSLSHLEANGGLIPVYAEIFQLSKASWSNPLYYFAERRRALFADKKTN